MWWTDSHPLTLILWLHDLNLDLQSSLIDIQFSYVWIATIWLIINIYIYIYIYNIYIYIYIYIYIGEKYMDKPKHWQQF